MSRRKLQVNEEYELILTNDGICRILRFRYEKWELYQNSPDPREFSFSEKSILDKLEECLQNKIDWPEIENKSIFIVCGGNCYSIEIKGFKKEGILFDVYYLKDNIPFMNAYFPEHFIFQCIVEGNDPESALLVLRNKIESGYWNMRCIKEGDIFVNCQNKEMFIFSLDNGGWRKTLRNEFNMEKEEKK